MPTKDEGLHQGSTKAPSTKRSMPVFSPLTFFLINPPAAAGYALSEVASLRLRVDLPPSFGQSIIYL